MRRGGARGRRGARQQRLEVQAGGGAAGQVVGVGEACIGGGATAASELGWCGVTNGAEQRLRLPEKAGHKQPLLRRPGGLGGAGRLTVLLIRGLAICYQHQLVCAVAAARGGLLLHACGGGRWARQHPSQNRAPSPTVGSPPAFLLGRRRRPEPPSLKRASWGGGCGLCARGALAQNAASLPAAGGRPRTRPRTCWCRCGGGERWPPRTGQ